MAIYHCSVQIIGRNSGRSSVAAAAYRSGEKLTNDYDGIVHDYTKKGWIEYTEILLPENAPEEYKDRGTLWNSVEQSEKSKDAQLCREFEIALPIEMSREEQIEIIHRFANDMLVNQGMIVDIAIHNPPVTNDRHQPIDVEGRPIKDIWKMQFINPHVHILTTMRPMDENGKWIPKSQIEYLCLNNGVEKGFTADEFKTAKLEGWEKQYKFLDGKKKIWLTASEGQARDLLRVNRSPKTSPYGRKNEIVKHWNSPERVIEWRQHWEKVVNDKFEEMQSDIRIDSRSFADQGREYELPTLHMGVVATNMEKRATRELSKGKMETNIIYSDIGNINREIRKHNRFVKELKLKLANTIQQTKEAAVRKLEEIWNKISNNNNLEAELFKKRETLTMNAIVLNETINIVENSNLKKNRANDESNIRIENLYDELAKCLPFQIFKKKQLKDMIEEQKKQIEVREDYVHELNQRYGIESEQKISEAKSQSSEYEKQIKIVDLKIDDIRKETEILYQNYEREIQKHDFSLGVAVISNNKAKSTRRGRIKTYS